MNSLVDSRSVLRPLLVLALPVLAEELLNMLVGYTDLFLASRFLQDDEFKAAMGLMAYTLWLIPSLFTFVGIGATAFVARSVGEGNLPQANRITHQALLAGLVLAVVVTIAIYAGGSSYIAAMQFSGPRAAAALRYLIILAPVVPLIMCEQVGTACLHGAGDTVTGLLVRIVVNIVNMIMSTALVIGWGPFPKLGWEGIALGTACAHGLGGLLIVVALAWGRHGLKLRPALFALDRELMRRLLRVGVPGGCDVLAVICCHMTYFSIIASLGTQAAAAHSLGVQIEALSYLPGSAFAIAAATLTGQYLGARDAARAVKSVLWATVLGGGVMCAAGLVFYFGGGWLAAFFTGSVDDPTGQITAQLLRVVAITMPSLALVSILTGALRGAGDTRASLIITFVGLVAVRLPLATWLAHSSITLPGGVTIAGWGLGVFGAWYAMVVDVSLRSVLVTIRYWQGDWKRIHV